jgi:adenosylhomocysteine nucleosidase
VTSPITVPLAVLYALTDEIRPLLKESSIRTKIITKPALIQFASFRGVNVVFCRTGVGLSNAHEAAERLFEHAAPALVLSAGCAGAAHPDLKAGDLVLPNEIRSEAPTDLFSTSERERSELERLIREEDLPYRVGPLMTLWKIAGKGAKEEAGSKGAACVDMETAAVAAIAEKSGIPLVSLRAIFDPLEEEFPSQEPYDEEHPVSYLLRNPKVLLKIPRYVKASALCQKNLFTVISRFIDSRSSAR